MNRWKTIMQLGIVVTLTVNMLTGCGSISADKNESTDKVVSQPEEKKYEIETQTMTVKDDYNDGEKIIRFQGLKEYKKITEGNFEDKAAKGKKYLVLFLNVKNYTEENVYINTDFFESEIDGKKLDHTVVVSSPEGYSTLFRNFESGADDYGFVVWEVPENWEKLSVTYKGFEYSNYVTLNMEFTKEDLKEPGQYEDVLPK